MRHRTHGAALQEEAGRRDSSPPRERPPGVSNHLQNHTHASGKRTTTNDQRLTTKVWINFRKRVERVDVIGHVPTCSSMIQNVRACATMREKSEMVVQCSNNICIDMVRRVPRAHGEDQVHLWIRGHHCANPTPHEFQPFQLLASSWFFVVCVFWTFLCVCKRARAGDRADSRTVSRRRCTICNDPERVT